MKKLLLILFLTGCGTEPEIDTIDFNGTVMYMEITNNHHVFTAFESELRFVSIPINQLPITPNHKELFHVKLTCNKFTSVCDVRFIDSIANHYP